MEKSWNLKKTLNNPEKINEFKKFVKYFDKTTSSQNLKKL